MKQEYQRIAIRTLDAARVTLNGGIHEIAAFNCYHAYESTASALAVSLHSPHGGGVHHRDKLNIFLRCVEQIGNDRVLHQVQRLNGQLESLRNKLLYPTQARYSQIIIIPENVITAQQVEGLIQNVQEVVNWVGQQI